AAVDVISPEHAAKSEYYSEFISDDRNIMDTWLSFEVLGILAGAFLSGAISGRLGFKTEHSPKITSKTRLLAAAAGGILFGFGSQLGRGCTSGAALSGMATLATAGFVTMLAIFGTGYVVAYFFRKLWI
ncbi:MAG TPA: YeeE/YedE thiosulfate transporter family protein, partial [Prolixibacteraceae bacterium]|nr:YeeE/YedE thiosulfate transporter family protein [Prolixibacteraceae bacterium]